ncbi:uncharacterized protein LOC129216232 [Uloborus diversus]|uniref:uncharacterized protein LOC129216232 n=1 Tax=Uloborus diversus TaxID=327109 RepID=UPI002409370C|nr:uncharacterized protein LOC129216232 [Uloborus diversus]XP_054706406.1 uncharacterized protein LOC129216232 [Uloborus diversus]
MALNTPAVDLSTPSESGIKIKKEKEDDDPGVKESSPPKVKNKQLSDLLSRNITITSANASRGEKSNPHPKPAVPAPAKPSTDPPAKPDPPPIDFPSTCGAFGWTTIGSVHLPFIMRGEDRFVSVRMVECKIISNYADVLPWTVFTCTNIKSYYITENEAKLLNEINSFHCEFQFGYQNFTTKDVVVRLQDTVKFYEFLETCKAKLNVQGSNAVFGDQCGYFLINYAPVPFIRRGLKKCVPLNMVYSEASSPITSTESVTEWELAYLKFLCWNANLGDKKLNSDTQLCSTEDLQNILGGIQFEEWFPNKQCSSINDGSHFSSSNGVLPKWGESVQGIHSASVTADDDKLREKINEIQDKDSLLNSFLGLNKYLDSSVSNSAHVNRNPHEQSNLLNSIQSSERTNIYSSPLENFLATSSSCNYPYSMDYHNQYTGQMQTSAPEFDRCRKSDGSLPSLASSRPKTFPPPPPLVRLGNSRIGSILGDPGMVPKASPSLYPYLPTAPSSNTSCPPWLARILEPDWLREDDNRSVLQSNEAPENLSRRLGEHDSWCPTSLPSNVNMNGAGSSSSTLRSNSNTAGVIRDNFDLSHGSLHSHGSSPRILTGPGPPPHYPTPPQSSPLQPLSFLDCAAVLGMTDIYGTRSTPNGLVDLCSPPPSPEMRTALSNSPRGTHVPSYGYQPHITRLVQVDSRYVLAINIEPLKYNSLLAVPISDVVNKFLRGTNVQSCQIVLETVFGLRLYECTSLQQEAFAKHNLQIMPGSKLVSLSDLKSCLYQLKFLLVEQEKMKEKHCDIGATELPLSKRWCGNAREC